MSTHKIKELPKKTLYILNFYLLPPGCWTTIPNINKLEHKRLRLCSGWSIAVLQNEPHLAKTDAKISAVVMPKEKKAWLAPAQPSQAFFWYDTK